MDLGLPPAAGFSLFHRPWGLGGSTHPALLSWGGYRYFHGFQQENAPLGMQLRREGLGHPGGYGRGEQHWGTPCPAMEGLELLGSQQAAMAPALGDLAPALKWRYFN